MDPTAIKALERAGMDPTHPELLRVPTVLGEQGRVVSLDQDLPVPVMDEEDRVVWLPLQPISQLWTGSAVAPDFSRSLRRRPDGVDPNPLFSYLRAAARLYLSLRDVSRAEFEAMADRLRVSAQTFASRLDSTSYHHFVLEEFFHPTGSVPFAGWPERAS